MATTPPFAAFRDALPVFFEWLRGGIAPSIPAAYVGAAGELTIRERTMRLPLTGRAQSHLEVIRFAASNRLCVDLRYQGSTRRIEPCSLRRTMEENIILHAHNRDKDEPRSYRVDRIEGANVTGETFNPRFAIELTPAGAPRYCTHAQRRNFWGRTNWRHDNENDAGAVEECPPQKWIDLSKRTDVCLPVRLL